jgi:hypothetical protein
MHSYSTSLFLPLSLTCKEEYMHKRKRTLALTFIANVLVLTLATLTWLIPSGGGVAHAAPPCSTTYWSSVLSGSDRNPNQDNSASVTVYGQYDRRTDAFCGSYFLAGTITITHTLPPGNSLNNWFDLQLTVDRKEVAASANEPGPGTYTLQTRSLPGTCVTLAMGFLYFLIANAGTVCAGS